MSDHEKVLEIVGSTQRAPYPFDANRAALVVVDVQRWFTEPDAPLARFDEQQSPGITTGYFERVATHVLPNIARLQQAFRAVRLPIVFLAVGSGAGGRDLPNWMRDFDEISLERLGHRIVPSVGDPIWQIDDRVAPRSGEPVLNKVSSGPLASTKLDQLLRNLDADSVVVCGLTTAICVAQTARELSDRSFRVIIAADACTERSEEMHEAALLSFGWCFGRVRATGEVIASIESSGGSTRRRSSAVSAP
jgi:nicotinamidase-related amidase